MIKKQLPMKHTSIRVPWHDNHWNGTVYNNSGENISCLFLKQINEGKNDDLEENIAGEEFSGLSQK